jgi:hypothetical protein
VLAYNDLADWTETLTSLNLCWAQGQPPPPCMLRAANDVQAIAVAFEALSQASKTHYDRILTQRDAAHQHFIQSVGDDRTHWKLQSDQLDTLLHTTLLVQNHIKTLTVHHLPALNRFSEPAPR